MRFSSLALIASALAAPVLALPAVAAAGSSEQTFTKRASAPKVIVDNDWSGSASWAPVMVLLSAGYDILGITATIGNSFPNVEAAHILRFLEIANITHIPVYKGAVWPLINTPERFAGWQAVFGNLAWSGAFTPANATLDAEGNDPTSGDPFRLVPIPEGLPTFLQAQNQSAVTFMIEQVAKYPGEVSIYAAGAATTIALAIKTDPTFAGNVKEIVYQGGYLDVSLFQVTPTPATEVYSREDVGADFNSFIDAEAAKIMFNAPFPKMTVTGTTANTLLMTQEMINEMYAANTSVATQLVAPYYNATVGVPLWDELCAGLLAFPEIITDSGVYFLDIDVSFSSNYGRTFAATSGFQPLNTQNMTYVKAVNETMFKDLLVKAVQGTYSTAV